jgi:hypothetical protein
VGGSNYRAMSAAQNVFPIRLWRLASSSDAENTERSGDTSRSITEHEGLPYTVEMLDHSGAFVDQVLAATKSASIGFAAYYAAVKEFPDRKITLRQTNSVVARWNAREH